MKELVLGIESTSPPSVLIFRNFSLIINLLANSANTNCCPFQVKINFSKFMIDGLQQRCHMTLLVSSFVTSRNLLFDVFLPRKIITILQKITINFRQVSLKGVLLSVQVLEYSAKSFKSTCEKVKSLKNFSLSMSFFKSGFYGFL